MTLPAIGTLSPRSKPQEVVTSLTALARQLGAGTKLPTILELCTLLGVSKMTLDRALRELEASEVIERRHGVGLFVAAGLPSKPRVICLICGPTFFGGASNAPFWELLIEQARARARAKGETLRLLFSAPDAASPLGSALLQDIRAGQVDGVIGVGLETGAGAALMEQSVPSVLFAMHSSNVGIDRDEMARLAASSLIRQGCRRIHLWRPIDIRPPEADPHRYDVEAFRHALAATSAQSRLDLTCLSCDPAQMGNARGSNQDQGYALAMSVFRGPSATWPDGIYFDDDLLTRGALTALQRLNLSVGQDVKIVSHANAGSPTLLGFEDCLTLVEVSAAELVDAIFGRLEAEINGGSRPAGRTLVPPHLKEPAGVPTAFLQTGTARGTSFVLGNST